jgi:hypothetical protein
MSPSSLAGGVIGDAVRHLAMLTVWVILVVAVVAAVVLGLRALCRRQNSGLRDRTADHEATARRSIRSEALLLEGAWPQPAISPRLPDQIRVRR